MRDAGLSALTVPYGADQTLYVIVDRISAVRDVRVERTDLETTIHDLVAGFFSEPLRVLAFNTLEHWMKDISAEIAAELQSRCDIDGTALPDHLQDFVERHIDCGHHAAASDRASGQADLRSPPVMR